MQLSFSGNNYFYKVFYYEIKSLYHFSIVAVHRETKRTSFITTTNFILDLCDINTEVKRFWESEWLISKEERILFTRRFEDCIKQQHSLIMLEKFLDEDRLEGEWENFKQ
ncbi:MAG: hypothetical protein A2315_17420 [Ignavibacteria bacterium RIFOXYB2_FULL_35_12]|nr:MAG: hypothetical protein A2058_02650 [Ignavibacteria bacterium GWA2_36_19]OGU52889.1 MAG: hypothetical protein A2006_03425 [Ignavibacteria bacterium GWC2_35_8]OGU57839.1 MAG: hypothetical protein A2X60_11585 [Ignavibacteria bacterium GWF2_35_20]OGU81879.1 MAG: hypothetical protein A2254_14345 [Ignavibacteria bacterium RIFOXYA2_FULL_35_9]OGU88062.1 MAG: hypothetical protein A3K31_16400 [Ignavibacteria bacterium RIFOXYA12_FULL_35_25]OGU93089.1 MAG: hypothetical protein A2347_07785 [Ignavibac